MSARPTRLQDHPYYSVNWLRLDRGVKLACAMLARAWARETIKPGDRLTVARCGHRQATFIMARWDGNWIVSRSGVDDLSPICVLRINGEHVVNPGIQELLGPPGAPAAEPTEEIHACANPAVND